MMTNVEIFQRVIEAFNREGADGVLPYYTEDAEVYDPDLPPGTYRGREAVSRVIEMTISGFDDVEVQDFRLLPAGDRVVGPDPHAPMERTGDLEIETRDAHPITFRDGKISYWRIYLDQAEPSRTPASTPRWRSSGTPSPS